MFGLSLPWDLVARGAALTTIALLWVVVLVRVVGLRSFSKITAFDFVTTIAMGSLLATAAASSSWSGFFQAVLAMGFLLGLQSLLAFVRIKSSQFRSLSANTPLLLMRDGRFCEKALRASRTTKADVLAKIRAANAPNLAAVRAVVLENTGDVTVMHGDSPADEVLRDVKRLS